MKEMTAAGIGVKTNSVDPFMTDDKNQLWKSGTIGFHSSKALSYGVEVFFIIARWKRFKGRVHGIYWTSEEECAGWIAITKG